MERGDDGRWEEIKRDEGGRCDASKIYISWVTGHGVLFFNFSIGVRFFVGRGFYGTFFFFFVVGYIFFF